MTSAVSVSFAAEQLRLNLQQGHLLLGCAGETWITKIYTIIGVIVRDKAMRLLFDEDCRSTSNSKEIFDNFSISRFFDS